MADNNKDLISNEVLQKATQDILQTVSEHLYEYTPYTNEEIAEIFDLDNVTAKSLSKVINDEYIAKNKVFSNEHTMELLSKTLAEANQYTTEQIANSGKLERKIVTSTSEVINENILYLILTDSTNNIYTQYMLIDGNATPLGTTEINLNDYLKTIDFNTAIDEYAKKNTVVLQNDVVGDLTTLSSNQVLCTQGVSDELDKKVDKSSIVTSIDSSSTDSEVVGAKTVYDLCVKDNNIKTYTTLEQLGLTAPTTVGEIFNATPIGSMCRILGSTTANLDYTITDIPAPQGILIIDKVASKSFDIEFKLSTQGSVSGNNKWIGQLKGGDGSGIVWQRVCTTSVSDIAETEITTFTDSDVNGKVIYSVKNGICYVTLLGLYSTTVKSNIKVCNLPSATTKPHVSLLSATKGTGQLGVGFLGRDGMFTMHIFIANSGVYTSFSYPVAES